jgi:hypothetical protein
MLGDVDRILISLARFIEVTEDNEHLLTAAAANVHRADGGAEDANRRKRPEPGNVIDRFERIFHRLDASDDLARARALASSEVYSSARKNVSCPTSFCFPAAIVENFGMEP